MGLTSTTFEGKVLDWHYKPINGSTKRFAFYIGDIFVGQIHKSWNPRSGWIAVCGSKGSFGICPLDGFKTRYYAAEFLLKIGGYQYDYLPAHKEMRDILEEYRMKQPIKC